MITIGSVIRNKKPYWGEPAHKIIGNLDKNNFVKTCNSGSKLGPGGAILQIHFGSAREFYEPCPWYIQAWLWVLGQTCGCVLNLHVKFRIFLSIIKVDEMKRILLKYVKSRYVLINKTNDLINTNMLIYPGYAETYNFAVLNFHVKLNIFIIAFVLSIIKVDPEDLMK